MRKTILCLALLAGLPAAASARPLGSLEFEPCTLAPPRSPVSIEAQCATLAVPENHAAPDGRKIELAIAWVPASGEAAPDPVFMLAGGPGQSAKDSYPRVASAFADVRRGRHVILVDQRGTGGSNPLVCRDAQGRGAIADDALDPTPEAAAEFAAKCRDELDRVADLRFYTTTDAIQDLDAVRQAIGAERINLVGGSYGTRVGQQYAKRYPRHTRTLVLDGVVPNALVLGSEHAKNLDDALALHFQRCRTDSACAERFGEPMPTMRELLAKLDAAPAEVSYRDALTGELRTEAFTRGHLALLLRMYSYSPTTAALLPLLLHEAANGRYEPLAAQASWMLGNLSDEILHGMQLSVTCAEDAAELAEDPEAVRSVMGNEFVAFMRAQCAVWQAGERPADFRAPLDTEVPTLLLSGELDPVTPPRYGEAVVEHLPNGRHLVVRGHGHITMAVGCMPKLVARFIEKADAKALDATCLDTLTYTPPFTSFNGWEP